MKLSPAAAARLALPVLALLITGTLCGMSSAPHTSHLAAVSSTSAEVRSAEADVRALREDAVSAEAAVAAAFGRVLDRSILDAVLTQAADARLTADTAAASLLAADETLAANTVEWSFLPWDLTSATDRVNAVQVSVDVGRIAAARADLAASKDAVEVAVAAWESEQARLEAADAAARVAEAKAEAARPKPSVPAPQKATGPASITVTVRTNVTVREDYNGQDAIDAGGQVGVVWPGVGTIVSAHNYNDSRALDLRVGDSVTFTGEQSGTFRVSGSVDVQRGGSVTSASSLGGSMFLQTCYFGTDTMRIVGLVPA